MSKSNDEESTTNIRKAYQKPTATKITREQAILKLVGHASLGHRGAKDLLEMMFPEVPSKDSEAKKISA